MRAIILGFSLGLLASACGMGLSVTTPCTTSNCSGCCDQQTGKCEAGNQPTACGTGGKLCIACAKGESCGTTFVCKATPVTCSAASCDGCCDDQAQCVKGQSVEACGAQGASCAVCGAGQACLATSTGATTGGKCQ